MPIDVASFILFVVGLVIGILLSYLLIKKVAEERARVELERWKQETVELIRKDTLERSRNVLKGKLGEQFLALHPSFPFDPSDARFLGNPIDYVIFDGYTEASENKDKNKEVSVIFLDVKRGSKAKLTRGQEKIKKAVEKKRVRWKTFEME
ncbi:MAG: Holliday junction resolvase-like protein [Nanoarchaeota archaeon]